MPSIGRVAEDPALEAAERALDRAVGAESTALLRLFAYEVESLYGVALKLIAAYECEGIYGNGDLTNKGIAAAAADAKRLLLGSP